MVAFAQGWAGWGTFTGPVHCSLTLTAGHGQRRKNENSRKVMTEKTERARETGDKGTQRVERKTGGTTKMTEKKGWTKGPNDKGELG